MMLSPEELAKLNSLTNYPKILTLWEREENKKQKGKVITGLLNEDLESITNVRNFIVQEKYHGTNLGIVITPEKRIFIRKRSGIIAEWINGGYEYYESLKNIEHYLECFKVVDFKKILNYFAESKSLTTIFGEGVSPKIQAEGITYTSSYDFIVFDIKCGNSFFDWRSVLAFKEATGLSLVRCFRFGGKDILKYDWEFDLRDQNCRRFFEGYVVRSEPPLLSQYGRRLMFKIKRSDFRSGQEKKV